MSRRRKASQEAHMGSKRSQSSEQKPNFCSPKALIHGKFGPKAIYRVEEVKEAVENACPGLATAQQTRTLYRCSLELPHLSVTSGTFTRKKDAEQSAAQIAVDKLGVESAPRVISVEGARDELASRLSFLCSDEFLSSADQHPLLGHFRVALQRAGGLLGMIPIPVLVAGDTKVNSLSKVINPEAEVDLYVVLRLLKEAASNSSSVRVVDKNWIGKQDPYSSNVVESLLNHPSATFEPIALDIVRIPCSIEEEPSTLRLVLSENDYYIDKIAHILSLSDSSDVLISRTVGKTSSDMRIYFPVSDCLHVSNMQRDPAGDGEHADRHLLNERASYLSGQLVHGDAILANIKYKWMSLNLYHENVSLCTYYRMLLRGLPYGNYKIARAAIFVAEVPLSYTRSNWKGPPPRELLCTFCRQHRLAEPVFSVANFAANLKESSGTKSFGCEVEISSRKGEPILEFSATDSYHRELDAIHNSALRILTWLNKYFDKLEMTPGELTDFASSHGIKIYPEIFSQELAFFFSLYGPGKKYGCRSNYGHAEILLNIEGVDSGVYPSPGSSASISYIASLVEMNGSQSCVLEENDEFEFEIGAGAVITQIESCISQLSVNQMAKFSMHLPPMDLILAAAGESADHLSEMSLGNCSLEFSMKLLHVTEPMEDRMEKALFSPPLSKQRVEFAVRYINELCAATLVDFGCGSGSLLDSLLEHHTCLRKLVGVDISVKGLNRAAKSLHQKLSRNSTSLSHIDSLVLYSGSITDFDRRLHRFDMGTCLEVIEHMEEEQAYQFGDMALGSFCPRVFIVSTPNYEYNSILQKSAANPNREREEEPEDQPGCCKFRNFDHKFEWTRAQFQSWATTLANRYGYSVGFSGVGGNGEVDPGFASQIAVFRSENDPTMNDTVESVEESGGSGSLYELIWQWPVTA